MVTRGSSCMERLQEGFLRAVDEPLAGRGDTVVMRLG
jgi:hypothetical protein